LLKSAFFTQKSSKLGEVQCSRFPLPTLLWGIVLIFPQDIAGDLHPVLKHCNNSWRLSASDTAVSHKAVYSYGMKLFSCSKMLGTSAQLHNTRSTNFSIWRLHELYL